jgi:hypothetical protein
LPNDGRKWKERHVTRSVLRQRRVLVFAGVVMLACSSGQDAPKVPLSKTAPAPADSAGQEIAAHALLGPAARAALDSGNALFRKKSYAAALAQYQSASSLAPQHSAPLFGIYMVARATNNVAMADSALAGIRLRSGAMTPAPHSLTDSALQRMHDTLGKKRPIG